jgi:hypothetical protein
MHILRKTLHIISKQLKSNKETYVCNRKELQKQNERNNILTREKALTN